MAVYAVVRASDGLIENVVVWDGATCWQPPDGTTAVALGDSSTGVDGWYDVGTGFHAPMPKITDIDPASGSTAGGTTVTITGYNLDVGTVDVKFDGTSATNITNRTKTSLDCDTPAHAAGQVNVTVENENGSWTGQNQLTNGYEYTS